jgi:hypothetical protein
MSSGMVGWMLVREKSDLEKEKKDDAWLKGHPVIF